METNSNKTIFLSELCSKAEQRSTSLPVPSESNTQCNTAFPWQGYSNISPNGEKWQLYGWFMALWITLHIITFSVQDHIKILHLLHLCMWQRAELPSPRWLIQAVWSSKTHQLLPVEPPSPGATLHLVLLFLFSGWALQTGLDPYKKHSKAGKNYTPQALREACMSFTDYGVVLK